MPRLSALILSLGASFPVLAATPEQDVQQYIQIFQGGVGSDKAVDDLGWKGISDERLFDIIEQRLRQDAQASSREGRNHAARLIKALGFSGQPKYAATLGSLSADYRRPVENAQ